MSVFTLAILVVGAVVIVVVVGGGGVSSAVRAAVPYAHIVFVLTCHMCAWLDVQDLTRHLLRPHPHPLHPRPLWGWRNNSRKELALQGNKINR